MKEGWVKVYTLDKQYRAELLKDKFEQNNIEAIILNKRDSAFNTFGSIEVFVHEDNKAKAEEIAKEFEE